MKSSSICQKCKNQFSWYKTKNRKFAKYCSKICKDLDHKNWCHRTKRNTQFLCEECKSFFHRRTSKNQKDPRFCSKKCMNKNVYTWQKKNRFIWDEASDEQKIERLRENFYKHVIVKDGCWDWNGSVSGNGYPSMIIGSEYKQTSAHRISWLIHKGPIPENLIVCHRCDTPICTNPDCLFLGSYKDNTQDMMKKGRDNRPRGEKHRSSKLKEKEVVEIKKLIHIGVKLTKISKDFNISYGALVGIKSGKTWRHVEP